MSVRSRLVLALAFSATAPAAPAAVSPAIQQHIDALLKRRLHPEPLPISPPNPFQLNGTVVREAPLDDVATRPATTEKDLTAAARPAVTINGIEALTAVVSHLKIGGVIVLKDQLHMVINGVPRKEGDTIASEWNNSVVQVRIARLSPGRMVLRYADAEITLKY